MAAPWGLLLLLLILLGLKTAGSLAQTCGGSISLPPDTGLSRIITSPGYPNGHAHNLRCLWTIQTSATSSRDNATHRYPPRIMFKVIDLDLQSDSSTGRCYDVVLLDDNMVLCVKKTEANMFSYLSKGNRANLRFHSDHAGVNKKGFKIQVWAFTECGGKRIVPPGGSGVIHSPRFPFPVAPFQLNCQWQITTTSKRRIQFSLSDHGSRPCSNYSLWVVNLAKGLQQHVCADGWQHRTWLAPVTNATFVLNLPRGFFRVQPFHMVYSDSGRLVQPAPPPPSCSISRYIAPGTTFVLTSPNWPGNYPHNAHCSYHLYTNVTSIQRTPTGSVTVANRLYFVATYFSIERSTSCVHDYLLVGSLRYCGTSQGPVRFMAQSSLVNARFVSDGNNNRPGFRITVSVFNGITTPPSITVTTSKPTTRQPTSTTATTTVRQTTTTPTKKATTTTQTRTKATTTNLRTTAATAPKSTPRTTPPIPTTATIQPTPLSSGTWRMWTAWSSCSASCGPGKRKRKRTCSGRTASAMCIQENGRRAASEQQSEVCTKVGCPATKKQRNNAIDVTFKTTASISKENFFKYIFPVTASAFENSVNDFCNTDPGECCRPGDSKSYKKTNPKKLLFVQQAGIRASPDSPVIRASSLVMKVFLIPAKPNPLCSSITAARRKKRAAVEESDPLSKAALAEAAKSVDWEELGKIISASLRKNLNIDVDIKVKVGDEEPQKGPEHQSWKTPLIASCVVLVVILIAVTAGIFIYILLKRINKKDPDNADSRPRESNIYSDPEEENIYAIFNEEDIYSDSDGQRMSSYSYSHSTYSVFGVVDNSRA